VEHISQGKTIEDFCWRGVESGGEGWRAFKAPETQHNSFREIYISLADLYIPLSDLCISRADLYNSLAEIYKWKEEICISSRELGRWVREIPFARTVFQGATNGKGVLQ